MIVSGGFGRLGKFRFWCDEPHVSDCRWFRAHKSDFAGVNDRAELAGVRSIVLEAMEPRGARTLYAMLGLHYLAETGEFRVNVVNHSPNSAVYEGSLIDDFEVAHFGLPANYAAASVAGMKRGLADTVGADGGRVDICCAAYGSVSSSEPFFEKLGFTLAHLLRLSCDDISEGLIGSYL
ncbi:hypothetical protein SAMN03159312_5774 [Pseudomonas sp. NFIX49]|jgi:hypothetical protein|nr:hypothetical protein SAMN03159312_5774 [Pseudomonas sp. NFIX49]